MVLLDLEDTMLAGCRSIYLKRRITYVGLGVTVETIVVEQFVTSARASTPFPL